MCGGELRLLQGADVGGAEELMLFLAEIAQPQPTIAFRIGADKARNGVVEQRIVIVQPLEADQRAHQRPGLARFDAGGEQKQQ